MVNLSTSWGLFDVAEPGGPAGVSHILQSITVAFYRPLAIDWLKSSEIGRVFGAGSCWAFGSLSAVDSRLCIATDGIFSGPQAQLSRGFATSCSKPGGGDGCAGQGLDIENLAAKTCGFWMSKLDSNFYSLWRLEQVWMIRHLSINPGGLSRYVFNFLASYGIPTGEGQPYLRIPLMGEYEKT